MSDSGPPSGDLLPAVQGGLTAFTTRNILVSGTAPNTRRAYRGDLAYFWTWAEISLGLDRSYPVPVEAVIAFVTEHVAGLAPEVDLQLVERKVKARRGNHKLATIERRVSALSMAHTLQRVPNPCQTPEVRLLLSKARRASARAGHRPEKKKAAPRDVLDAMIETCDESLIGVRDKALLLFAFSSGGRRRSEVADARVEDLTPVAEGFVFRLPRSKTDQTGEGTTFPVVGRAAAALRTWMRKARISTGPLFRGVNRHGRVLGPITGRLVARLVQKRAKLAGYEPRDFAGHSLRSGFMTEGGRQRHSLGDLMALSGHRSTRIALDYHQAGAVVHNPAAHLAD